MLRVPHALYHHAMERCYLCLNVDNLVDTQVSIEGEGILAICSTCADEMYRVLHENDEDEDEVQQLADLVQRLTDTNETLTRRERALRGQLKPLRERIDTKVAEVEALKVHVEFQAQRIHDLETAGLRAPLPRAPVDTRPPGYSRNAPTD